LTMLIGGVSFSDWIFPIVDPVMHQVEVALFRFIALFQPTPPPIPVYIRHPDLIVDLQGFPGDKSPDMRQFYSRVSELLAKEGIVWCLGGDQVLSYFNVPFVISDQEIVVPDNDVETAIRIFSEASDFCIPFRGRHHPTPYNIISQFQRFKVVDAALYFIFVPSSVFFLPPLTPEIFVNNPSNPYPVLYLRYYIEGLGKMHPMYSRVLVEYTVDAMDLDEAWCERNLDPEGPAWKMVVEFAGLKKERFGTHPKYAGNITCLIETKEQLEQVHKWPGRDLPAPALD